MSRILFQILKHPLGHKNLNEKLDGIDTNIFKKKADKEQITKSNVSSSVSIGRTLFVYVLTTHFLRARSSTQVKLRARNVGRIKRIFVQPCSFGA